MVISRLRKHFSPNVSEPRSCRRWRFGKRHRSLISQACVQILLRESCEMMSWHEDNPPSWSGRHAGTSIPPRFCSSAWRFHRALALLLFSHILASVLSSSSVAANVCRFPSRADVVCICSVPPRRTCCPEDPFTSSPEYRSRRGATGRRLESPAPSLVGKLRRALTLPPAKIEQVRRRSHCSAQTLEARISQVAF